MVWSDKFNNNINKSKNLKIKFKLYSFFFNLISILSKQFEGEGWSLQQFLF